MPTDIGIGAGQLQKISVFNSKKAHHPATMRIHRSGTGSWNKAVICPEAPPQISEAPDCIVRVDGRSVGLEHTQFFYPTPPGQTPAQQTDSLTDLAVEQARRLSVSATRTLCKSHRQQ